MNMIWLGLAVGVGCVVAIAAFCILVDTTASFGRRAIYILTTPVQWLEGLLSYGIVVGIACLLAGVTKLFMMISWMF